MSAVAELKQKNLGHGGIRATQRGFSTYEIGR